MLAIVGRQFCFCFYYICDEMLTESLLTILLKDRSTNENIIWGTNNYSKDGDKFHHNAQIKIDLITGDKEDLIRLRTKKEQREQKKRIRDRAEVFTPSWVCNAQNNLIDNAWFKQENCFNKENGQTWTTTITKIPFENSGNTWQNYVLDKRLEISCGEAPYLVSRYDSVTGEIIEPKNRIGILDRKIRVINENANHNEWFDWIKRAFQSSYGYEWQGDSLLIARKNLFYTFCDYYFEKYNTQPNIEYQKEIAEIISWNIWQMDGLKGVIPNSDGTKYCKTRNWATIDKHKKNILKFVDFIAGESEMKFNAIVGNPPYQEYICKTKLNNSLGKQLFPNFIVNSIRLDVEFVSLITPSRWFAGDAQDGSFIKLRKFVKHNNHFLKIFNYPDATEIFNNVIIKGGVSYWLFDKKYSGKIEFNTRINDDIISEQRNLFEEGLDVIISNAINYEILEKVKSNDFIPITTITKGRDAFGIIGKRDIVEKISKPEKYKNAVALQCMDEEIRWTDENSITKGLDVFNSYKVFISKSAGDPSKDKKVIGKAYPVAPKWACTDSLFPIGCFDNEIEAKNLAKYMATRFLRFMVSILKVSQNVTQAVYKFVPLQNFTSNSDIDWSKSIAEIDMQLYKKYALTSVQIAHIEANL